MVWDYDYRLRRRSGQPYSGAHYRTAEMEERFMKWLPVAIIVISTTAADLLKSLGMRKHGEVRDFRPGALGAALMAIARNWFVIIAMLADVVSFLAFIALLSMAELSFAVPATAAIFVLETICAKMLLKETVSFRRWVGVSCIMGGVVLLSR